MNEVLLQVAAASIKFGVVHDAPILWSPRGAPEEAKAIGSVFCSIKYKGELFGCMGVHGLSLFDCTRQAAFKAAFRDLRFPTVNKNHLEYLQVQIHVIDTKELLVTPNQRRLGHTIVLRINGRSEDTATLLPEYADPHVEYSQILAALRRKGNVSPEAPDTVFSMIARATDSTEYVALKDIPPLTTETRE